MARLFAWFSQLLPREAPLFDRASKGAFDEVDRYFLALRFGSAAAAVAWLWKLSAPGAEAKAATLVAVFVAYSLWLYVRVWRRPRGRARAYLAVLPADLLFLVLVCLWSAEPMSGLFLAFYLLVALHAFYFGGYIGIGAAAGFAVLYSAVYVSLPSSQRCSLEELFLRLVFAFFIAFSLALVSGRLRTSRDRLFEANRQLQHRNRVLEQTYRHLSLGRLAGDVAHNINNPTAVILSTAELLRRQAERDGLCESYGRRLALVGDNALRIGRIVRSLVALSQQQDGPVRSLDLAQLAESVAVLFETRAAERSVRIDRRLVPGLRVMDRENALRQVMVNLICNALDAVSDGGRVRLETRVAPDGDAVELRVSDDGHGIPPEHLDAVFSPFFSTKDGADGVGLGLSLSLAMARRLGGTLHVDSAPGRGSTFTLALPVERGSVAEEEVA